MQAARVIGGAGTGKTREALELMAKVIEAGTPPHRIGFCSFTKAARREAATRAASQFDCKPKDLEQDGWFRTIHSICYKCLETRSGTLLADDAESIKWVEEALEDKLGKKRGGGDELGEDHFAADTPASTALKIWGVARNRLQPLRAAWEDLCDRVGDLPYADTEQIVTRYESHKRMDWRMDFHDLVGQFAGYKFNIEGPERVDPEGGVPDIPVWFLDEAQDISPLLGEAFERLTSHPKAKFVYLFGDPFQNIHYWNGANHRVFLDWKVAKERVMPKSYRCPSEILDLGERILQRCSDYFDREISAVEQGGEIEERIVNDWLHFIDEIDPREDWLILARTNRLARRIARFVNLRGLPCCHIQGYGNWKHPNTRNAIYMLQFLEEGLPIDAKGWKDITKLFRSKENGVQLLKRGTKTKFLDLSKFDPATRKDLNNLEDWGATPDLIGIIKNATWQSLTKEISLIAQALAEFGNEIVDSPRVRMGTIHSAKGMEADNVLLLTTINERTAGIDRQADDKLKDAERRVEYVGVTRARKRLVLARKNGSRRHMKFD